MPDLPLKFLLFFACWFALGIGNFVFFRFNRNAVLKKQVLWRGHFVLDLLFLGFMAWLEAPIQAFALAVPALALITLLNLWGTKFCPRCGVTLIHAYRTQYCSHCGQSLTQPETEQRPSEKG